jgi:hypothetical protein
MKIYFKFGKRSYFLNNTVFINMNLSNYYLNKKYSSKTEMNKTELNIEENNKENMNNNEEVISELFEKINVLDEEDINKIEERNKKRNNKEHNKKEWLSAIEREEKKKEKRVKYKKDIILENNLDEKSYLHLTGYQFCKIGI